jgi:PHD/YefM family antitoxin component YafN of YafNO toxin-antitoxin module
MKTLALENADPKVRQLGDDVAAEPLVLTRNGKPVAYVVGLRGYDAEDLETMADPEFWKMIHQRRQDDSDAIPLEEIEAQLEREEEAERKRTGK